MNKNDQVFFGEIPVNESDQFISVRGDQSKPVLLVLHGGPGSPCMSFFRKKNKPLLDDFLVVTWDQRGTGRSYFDNIDKSKLTVDQIVADIHAVTTYLKKEYAKEKIFLMGHSFGATVGLRAIHEKPENYYAYFGVSQFINAEKNEALCYEWLQKTATEKFDKAALRMLKSIGRPVQGFYTSGLKDTTKAKQLVEKYGGSTHRGSGTVKLLANMLFSPEYGGANFSKAIKGISVSLSTIGFTLKGIDYASTIQEVKIPVYFFSGNYDMLTPQSILREYFEDLKAPQKELFIFENSAHNPLWEEGDKFHNIIHEIAKDY